MPMEEAKRFLQEIKDCKEKKYPSSGQGWDYRFEGKDKVGSALVYRQRIIHMAFFKIGGNRGVKSCNITKLVKVTLSNMSTNIDMLYW